MACEEKEESANYDWSSGAEPTVNWSLGPELTVNWSPGPEPIVNWSLGPEPIVNEEQEQLFVPDFQSTIMFYEGTTQEGSSFLIPGHEIHNMSLDCELNQIYIGR